MSLQPPTVSPPDVPSPTEPPPGRPPAGPASPTEPAVRQASPALLDLLRGLDAPADDEVAAARPARRPWKGLFLGAAGAVVLASLMAASWLGRTVFGDPLHDLDLKLQPAERGKVTYVVVEKGELEAVRNTEVLCRVRNKTGNWFATTIKWLIEDGAQVRKGDVVARLDDGALRQQYTTQVIAVTEKRALLVEAEREQEIVASQNRINIKTAQNNAKITRLNLDKYLKGDLKAKRSDIQGRMSLARSELKQWQDRLSWSARMSKQGFISGTQLEAEEIRLKGVRINLEKLLEEERVLEDYESKATALNLLSKLEQAEVTVMVAQTEAEGKAAKAEANLRAKSTVLEQEEIKLKELAEDMRYCTLAAPNHGMVVYNVTAQARAGSQKAILAVGEPVYENKVLFRIPDLRKMQVRVKVHESVQTRLRPDKIRKTYRGTVFEVVQALAAPGPDLLGAALAAPAARHLAVEEGLLQEDAVVRAGQTAQVKVASTDRVLTGQVHWISTVASQLDSLSSDVRVYPTVITLYDSDEDLRPGVSAEVTIFGEERDNVVRLPVHAVLEVAGEKFCYVQAGNAMEKRVLETGLNNNRFLEIRQGLAEGELVVQNPRALAERRGDLSARPGVPATPAGQMKS